MCFTADEIFSLMAKGSKHGAAASVHLLEWPAVDPEWRSSEIEEQFSSLMELRPFVLKALEEKRRTGDIGSSLEARVVFETASDRDEAYLKDHSAILHTVFIVSQVEIKRVEKVDSSINEKYNKTRVIVEKANGQKCSRCWNYKIDVGTIDEHPAICGSCARVVKEIPV